MNKKFGIIAFAVLGFLFLGIGVAAIQKGYTAQNDILTFSTTTPPGLMWVTDQAGKRSGTNPSAKLQPNGFPKDYRSAFLSEIPRSQAEEQNVDDDGVAEPTTPWLITVLDGGNQTYMINLLGMTEGVQNIIVQDAPVVSQPKAPQNKISLLIQTNVIRQVKVDVDASSHTMVLTRIVGAGDLLSDLQSACRLGLVAPGGTCQDLGTKASSVIKDANNKDTKSEAQHVSVFLNALNSAGKKHVYDPAFTILQEEAQTLLNTLNGQ